MQIIRLSNAAYRKSLQNLWWAADCNVLAIPIAAGALNWAGISVLPALAAVLMGVSTIVLAQRQLVRGSSFVPQWSKKPGRGRRSSGRQTRPKATIALPIRRNAAMLAPDV